LKKLILAALMIPAGPAAALDEAKVPAAPVTAQPAGQKPPVPPLKYSPEMQKAMKNLALLLERGAEIPPARLEALAPELARFNGKLEDALGPDLIADAARREKAIEAARRAAAAVSALQEFRSALQTYYGVNGGKYPADPAELASDPSQAIPELLLPDHSATAKVTIIDSRKYDDDFTRAVTDSGGWLYFSNQDSVNYGLLLIDCRHTAPDGTEFFKY